MSYQTNPLHDFIYDSGVTGGGIFAAFTPTSLVAPSAGFTGILVCIRQTTFPPAAIGRVSVTDNNQLGSPVLRLTFFYGCNILLPIDPLTIGSLTFNAAVGYDIFGSMVRDTRADGRVVFDSF